MRTTWIWMSVLVACGGTGETEKVEPAPEAPQAAADSGLLRLAAEVEVTTIKNGTAPVVGRFAAAEGEIHVQNMETWEGMTAAIRLPLIQWDSGLAIRDERIRNTFFRVENVPRAVLEIRADQAFDEPLAVGGAAELSLEGSLSVGGPAAPVALSLRVERTGVRAYSFSSVEPAKVAISKLGLTPQLEALVELCGHESVGDEVTISFKGKLKD